MFRSAYDNLVPGGRFVAYTINPDFTLSKPNNTKYGVTILRETLEADRYVCEAEFVTHPPTPFSYYRWSQATYESAIKEAGFRAFAWHPSEVAPGDIAHYGEAYWHDFHDNCLVIGLVCQK
jgi:toxoflavin synthase